MNDHSFYIKMIFFSSLLISAISLHLLFIHQYYVSDLSPTEAQLLMNDNHYFIDVRSPQEYQYQSPQQSINIPLYFIDKNQTSIKNEHFLQDIKQLIHMNKNSTLIIICQSGGRSKQAANLLAQADYQQVYNVTGGFELWFQQGLPIQ
jgi:rhodanese-related sulfurtransferase